MALRQPPNDRSRQKNSKHSKITPEPPYDSYSQIFFKHRPISLSMGESENAGLRAASYDHVHALGILARSRPLSKLIKLGAGPYINCMFLNTGTKKLYLAVSPLTDNRNLEGTLYKRKAEEEMQPRDAGRPGDIP
jgi:hypothetical protein